MGPTLWEALEGVPDRREASGRRYPLAAVLAIAVAAMPAGAGPRWPRSPARGALGELRVPPGGNEITAALALPKGLALDDGLLVTGDAEFAQRSARSAARSCSGAATTSSGTWPSAGMPAGSARGPRRRCWPPCRHAVLTLVRRLGLGVVEGLEPFREPRRHAVDLVRFGRME